MKRLTTVTLAALVASAASVALAAEPLVSEVDVVVELEDAANANALEYWPTIESDLESKFNTSLASQMNDSGYDVTVRLSEVSLDGSKLLGSKGEFNTLQGWVFIRENGKAEPIERLPINLSGKIGEGDPEAAFNIPPSIDEMYEALTSRFVEIAVERISEL